MHIEIELLPIADLLTWVAQTGAMAFTKGGEWMRMYLTWVMLLVWRKECILGTGSVVVKAATIQINNQSIATMLFHKHKITNCPIAHSYYS